ncbi:hypothetical protein [Capillimicrobium parvum]|nr:hypothetical protein [Capillimicrobium parvum]
MATATPPRAAPATMARWLPAVATIVGVAALLYLVYDPWYLNYDARYALLWAHDLWHGFTPEYTADYAPTPHPLQMAVSSIALPFGDNADRVMVLITLLCFGALVWLVFRLGSRLFTPWAGALAALVVLTRPAIERDAVLAYQDLPFEALIVGAVLLEAVKPKRGVPVLAVLAVAGLLRPEAWVLSGLYVLYLWAGRTWQERAKLVAVALIAPVVWAASDWIITGDPLHSLHGTSELAASNDRRRSITQVPRWGAAYLAFTLREPLILGVPIGMVFAWMYRRRQGVLIVAVVVAMLAVFAIGPLFGLPLIGRYVRTPAILLSLFYGAAVFGWQLLPKHASARRWWMGIGAFALLLSLVFIPKQLSMLRDLDQRFAADSHLYADLRKAAEAPKVKAAFAVCAPLSTADHRPIPYFRFWAAGPPGSVGTVRGHASPLGELFLQPRHTKYAKRFYKKNFPKATAPARYTRIYRNRSYAVFASPRCVRRLPA